MSQVTFKPLPESPSKKVARSLLEHGYALGTLVGERTAQPEREVISILKSDPNGKRGFFGGEPRLLKIGSLWFDNPPRGATFKKWVLEVYGDSYVAELRNLAEKLASENAVDISVVQTSEKPRAEQRDSDFTY